MKMSRDVELLLSIDELAVAAGISRTRLTRLVALGVVDPIEPDPPRFAPETAMRLRGILRLHRDLRVNMVGAAVILDLVERLERIQAELPHSRRPI